MGQLREKQINQHFFERTKIMTEPKQKPTRKLKSGLVSLAVWENTIQTDNGPKTVQNITVQRSYKDNKTGKWMNTDSYTPASLGNLLAVVLQAIVLCNVEEADDIPV
jgi:hypothetical protein